LVSWRYRHVQSGQSVVLRPVSSRYQLPQPEFHTVPFIWASRAMPPMTQAATAANISSLPPAFGSKHCEMWMPSSMPPKPAKTAVRTKARILIPRV